MLKDKACEDGPSLDSKTTGAISSDESSAAILGVLFLLCLFGALSLSYLTIRSIIAVIAIAITFAVVSLTEIDSNMSTNIPRQDTLPCYEAGKGLYIKHGRQRAKALLLIPVNFRQSISHMF